MQSIYKKSTCCAQCGNTQLNEILDLHDVPLAGFFPDKTQLHEHCIYPLKLMICPDCKLVQTDSCINPDTLFKDYRYMSSIGLSNHFKDLAVLINNKYDIKNKQILESGVTPEKCNERETWDGMKCKKYCEVRHHCPHVDNRDILEGK